MGTQARIGSVEIDMYKKTGIQHTLDKCCIPVYTIYFGKPAKNFRGKIKVFKNFPGRLLKQYIQKHIVPVVLVDAKIALCDPVWGYVLIGLWG